MLNVCYCGKQAGYPHAPDCPYPLFRGSDEEVERWENTRQAMLAPLPTAPPLVSESAPRIARAYAL